MSLAIPKSAILTFFVFPDQHITGCEVSMDDLTIGNNNQWKIKILISQEIMKFSYIIYQYGNNHRKITMRLSFLNENYCFGNLSSHELELDQPLWCFRS